MRFENSSSHNSKGASSRSRQGRKKVRYLTTLYRSPINFFPEGSAAPGIFTVFDKNLVFTSSVRGFDIQETPLLLTEQICSCPA